MGLESLIKKREAAGSKKSDADRLKVPEGTSVEVVFLEELEDIAETHQVDEWHVSGNGDFRSLVDTTAEEGGCYAAEIYKRLREHANGLSETERKAFYQKYSAKKKQVIYLSLVRVDEPGKTYFTSQGINSGLINSLIDDINDGEKITDAVYRISKGPNKSDSWAIKRLPKAALPEITAQPYRIEEMTINVPLADQSTFFAKVEPKLGGPEKTETTSAPAASAQW